MPERLLISPRRTERILSRLAYEIVEHNADEHALLLVGIERSGTPIARRLADRVEEATGLMPECVPLDVTSYRDDTDATEPPPPPKLPPTTGRAVILVDDVLFTGRTARAALDAVIRAGRPARVHLAVLIDRGHREIPLRPDFVGRVLPTKFRERVVVHPHTPAVYLEEPSCDVETIS